MMFEVEKKVRLDDAARQSIEAYVQKKAGGWGPELAESDRYYRASGFRKRIQTRSDYLARVRVHGETATLNIKKLSDQPGVIIEHETLVASPNEAEAILEMMGAEFACTITKRRRKARVDGVELLLDDIEELGTYLELSIEVEKFDESVSALKRIDSLLQYLGVFEVELRGYPDIALEQQGVSFDRKR